MWQFDPEIWGTVSDWLMVAVTTLTAYYLYKTLKSQKEVQITQNRLFEIESVRFRESIKPDLKYKISENIITPQEKENSRIYSIEVTNESLIQHLKFLLIIVKWKALTELHGHHRSKII
ncbi:hypothetical protein [Flavobacterium chilense]|uniref:Uncharacterized protein n=1 Tax=Flavobacterium chilense TaxID=946677 RepID=A0A1M7IUD8_9FLAO|nr:hypothetical protein [Flavobacterium chilense]SHM44361.1 hypothetical protein SAMN05444484_10652 [Flavobacterium chilense]